MVRRVNRSTREPYTLHWSGSAKRAINKELPEAVAAAALQLILGALRGDPRHVGKPLHASLDGIWSARRAMLAAGGSDSTTRLYDVSDPTRPGPLGDPLAGHDGYLLWVAFGPDDTLATAGADRLVWLWDTTNRQHPVTRYQQPLRNAGGAILAVAFAADGTLAMANADTRSAWLWDVSGARPRIVAKLTGHEAAVFSVAFSPTGDLLATGSADGSAVLWNTDPAEVIRKICAGVGEPSPRRNRISSCRNAATNGHARSPSRPSRPRHNPAAARR